MDIDKMVNHKIAKLSGIIKRQIYQIISEEGLDITPEQWVILVYLWENDGLISDLSTYIDPSKYNQIFADTSLSAQNFWVQTAVQMEVRRNISAKQIPNL